MDEFQRLRLEQDNKRDERAGHTVRVVDARTEDERQPTPSRWAQVRQLGPEIDKLRSEVLPKAENAAPSEPSIDERLDALERGYAELLAAVERIEQRRAGEGS